MNISLESTIDLQTIQRRIVGLALMNSTTLKKSSSHKSINKMVLALLAASGMNGFIDPFATGG